MPERHAPCVRSLLRQRRLAMAASRPSVDGEGTERCFGSLQSVLPVRFCDGLGPRAPRRLATRAVLVWARPVR